MLTLKNNLLSTDRLYIDSHDSIIELCPDIIDCVYFGVLTLSNNITKTLQFIKINNFFKARLNLYQEELNYLHGSTLKIVSVSSSFTRESNIVRPDFDIEKIKLTIKQSSSQEMSETLKELLILKEKVNALSLGKIVPTVNIANKDYIKPGMTLIAIDEGNFIAAYPFADVIKIVNGQQAVDGVVEIDASMIKYTKERTVEQYLQAIATAVSSQNETLNTLSQEIKSISQRVADLSIKLATHLDNGIL